MRRLTAAALIVVVVAFAPSIARAADMKVTYYASPEGATLIEDGQKTWGATPMWMKYPVPRKWTACLTLRPMTVRWLSGAEASTALTVCPANGRNQMFTFLRPTGVPGLEVDAQYGIQIQQMRMQQAQIDMAAWAALAARVQPRQPLHCSSQVIGWQVFTNCY